MLASKWKAVLLIASIYVMLNLVWFLFELMMMMMASEKKRAWMYLCVCVEILWYCYWWCFTVHKIKKTNSASARSTAWTFFIWAILNWNIRVSNVQVIFIHVIRWTRQLKLMILKHTKDVYKHRNFHMIRQYCGAAAEKRQYLHRQAKNYTN